MLLLMIIRGIKRGGSGMHQHDIQVMHDVMSVVINEADDYLGIRVQAQEDGGTDVHAFGR